MNYFLPVQLGAPDYNNKDLINSISNIGFHSYLVHPPGPEGEGSTAPIPFLKINKFNYFRRDLNTEIKSKAIGLGVARQKDSIGSYLAGLWEGDGHVYVPSDFSNNIKNTWLTLRAAQTSSVYDFKEAYSHIMTYNQNFKNYSESILAQAPKNLNTKLKVLKKSYPYLAITFPIKDRPLIDSLISLLGGRIREKIEENALV